MAGWFPLFAPPIGGTPLAAILSQTSVVSNPKPEFLIYGQWTAGDVIQFERQVDGGDWSAATITTHTVTSGEIGGTAINLSLPSLSAGSYEYRAKYKHAGGSYGPYSPVENGVVDLTLNFTYQGLFFYSGTGGGTVKTITAASAGTAYTNRRVFVFGVQTDNGGSNVASSFKINNVAATLFPSSATNGYNMYYCATALVPAGNTVDLELTMSAGSFILGPAAIYTCDDSLLSSSTPNDVKHIDAAVSTSATISNLATLSGGVTVSMGLIDPGINPGPTITTASDAFLLDVSDTQTYMAAHAINNQTRTASLTWGWGTSAHHYTTAWSFR
jgi:hypothetical protein